MAGIREMSSSHLGGRSWDNRLCPSSSPPPGALLQETKAPHLPLSAQPAVLQVPRRQVPLLQGLEEHQPLGVHQFQTLLPCLTLLHFLLECPDFPLTTPFHTAHFSCVCRMPPLLAESPRLCLCPWDSLLDCLKVYKCQRRDLVLSLEVTSLHASFTWFRPGWMRILGSAWKLWGRSA